MLVASSAMSTLALYVAYTLIPETVGRYSCGSSLAFSAIPVALGLVRYLHLTYSRADVGRPDKVVLSDRVLWLVIASYCAVAAFVLTGGRFS
jgi:hypothetical protein